MLEDIQTLIIFNPTADHGRAAVNERDINFRVSQFSSTDLINTEYPGHAKELAIHASKQGYQRIISVGGDGTVHEIANGLIEAENNEIVVGVIPCGSGNDLALGLDLPKEPADAIDIIFHGQEKAIDLAWVADGQGRKEVATNAVGIGFDATVGIQSQTITRLHGFPMYTLAVLRTIAFYYQLPYLRLKFDDEAVEQRSLMLSIGLGNRVGGGYHLTPDALNDDDLLDSCTVNPVGRITMLAMMPRVMRGTHITSKHVTMRQSRVIEVKSDLPLPIHIDGEVFAVHDDDVRQLTVTSLPGAMRIMLPN